MSAEPCEHEWHHVDASFAHEFGTKQIHFWECSRCGETSDTRPDDLPDPADAGCDDDEPNYDAERPLTPLENWGRNDEHNVS